MSSFREIGGLLRSKVQQALALSMPAGSRIFWPNQSVPEGALDPALGPLAGVVIGWGQTEAMTVGRPARVRYRGTLEVLLAWPEGLGEGPLLEVADKLAELLRRAKVGALRLGMPSLEPEDWQEGWHARRFLCDWTAVDTSGLNPADLGNPLGSWASGSGALREALSAVVASIPGLRVVLGNAPAEPLEVTEACVYGEIIPGAQIPTQATLVAEASSVGVFEAAVLLPSGEGDNKSLEVVDQISLRLSLAQAPRLSLGTGAITEQGRRGAAWLTTLQFPYVITTPP